MKKRIVLSSVFTVVALIAVLFNSKEQQDIGSSSEKVITQNTTHTSVADAPPIAMEEELKVSKSLKHGNNFRVRAPAFKREKARREDDFKDYPRVPLELFNNTYYLVEGLQGSHQEIAGASLVKKMNGFFFYEAKSDQSMEVVFNKKTQAYGLFTGEVIVQGNYNSVISYLEGKPFEILYKNQLTHQVILKINGTEELGELGELEKIPNVSVSPDIKYSRRLKI